MKYKIPITIALIAAAMVGQAKAAFISGEIHFSNFGNTPPDLTDLGHPTGGAPVNTATGVLFGPSPNAMTINEVTDDFTIFATPFSTTATFNSFTVGSPVSKLWILTGNGLQFNLNAGSTSAYTDTALKKEFSIEGTGFVIDNRGIPGAFDSTPGEFSLVLDRTKSAVSFSFTSTASATPVPEPTTMIAGALLLVPFGMGVFRSLRNRKQTV